MTNSEPTCQVCGHPVILASDHTPEKHNSVGITDHGDDLNAQIALHNLAIKTCAQSWLCHPDWDADDHLAYLQSEVWEADLTPETPITVVAWPEGPSTAPLERFVQMWLRIPDRSFESTIRGARV